MCCSTTSAGAKRRRWNLSHSRRYRNARAIVAELDAIPVEPANRHRALAILLREFNHRHTVKNKDVSFKTMHERRQFLRRAFMDLARLGQPIDPRSLDNKKIRLLVDRWLERGLGAATIQTYLSFLSALADWIGKPGLVRKPEFYVGDASRLRRSYIATNDKSWSANGVDAEALIAKIAEYDRYCGAWLDVISAFGLRVREAQMLKPHRSVVAASATGIVNARAEWYLHVFRGTKGGRERFVPIDSDTKRAAIERAKALAPTEESHLGNPDYPSLKRGKERFYNVMKRFGVTRRELGVTAHGLRHEYANDRYERFAGVKAPLRNGPPVEGSLDVAARVEVAAELGHSRRDITAAYCGTTPRSAQNQTETDKPETKQ